MFIVKSQKRVPCCRLGLNMDSKTSKCLTYWSIFVRGQNVDLDFYWSRELSGDLNLATLCTSHKLDWDPTLVWSNSWNSSSENRTGLHHARDREFLIAWWHSARQWEGMHAINVSRVVKEVFYHLCQASQPAPYLFCSDLASVIHATVTSRLDYHNVVCIGLCLKMLQKFLADQNEVARLLTAPCPQPAHLTPMLWYLHWLLISFQCQF